MPDLTQNTEKIISDAPDVQGLSIKVITKEMQLKNEPSIQAGFLQSLSGIKGGSRESTDLTPINDLDYEPIASVGQKKYSDVQMSILFKFVAKDAEINHKEGVNLIEEAFDKNEEIFFIITLQDERKTTLKIRTKITNFEVKTESNSKLSADITAKKLGESQDITALNAPDENAGAGGENKDPATPQTKPAPENKDENKPAAPAYTKEADAIHTTTDKPTLNTDYADKKGKTLYFYAKQSAIDTPVNDDTREKFSFTADKGTAQKLGDEVFKDGSFEAVQAKATQAKASK